MGYLANFVVWGNIGFCLCSDMVIEVVSLFILHGHGHRVALSGGVLFCERTQLSYKAIPTQEH